MNDIQKRDDDQDGGPLHLWIVAGMVSGAARFLPVPFVDDIVRDQCRRLVVSRTLAMHETSFDTGDLKPLYASDGGCLSGCIGFLAKVPVKLLLFPIRKIIAIVTSVRGVPLEIVRMVLLGRTLDRCLADGRLSSKAVDAAGFRHAFDASFSRMDFHVLRAAVSDALASVADWKTSAMDAARQLQGTNGDGVDDFTSRPAVHAGAERIEAVVRRPEVTSLFDDFDRRFDATLQHKVAARR